MNEILTYDDLIQYINYQLGAPIVRVNISRDQFMYAIQNTLKYYRQYHYNGSERSIIAYPVTQTDIDNKYITLDPTVNSIREVYVNPGYGNMLGWHGITAMSFWDSFLTAARASSDSRYSVSSYMELEMQLGDLRSVFNSKVVWNFQRVKYKLNIVADWSLLTVGDYIIIDCTTETDPEMNPEVFNDVWFREMCVQQCKRQWGQNLSKYGNVQLPGGVTIDGQTMMNDADTKIQELKDQVETKWQLPPMMVLG